MRSAGKGDLKGRPSKGYLGGGTPRCDRIAATVVEYVDLAWKPLRLRGFLFDLRKLVYVQPGELDPSSPTLYQES